jgi:4-amino-4-deoxy-L-arabinose transferase-like glycosyltransferase
MTHAIRDAGWGIPVTVAWNGMELPFAYPPLGFYLAGGLETIGLDIFGVFRWLPLLASTLVVPAVYLLGRELLRSDVGGAVAALAYALAPASYVWLIQGGGVTRAPGLLLGVLCVWLLVRLVRSPGPRLAAVAGVFAGLTALVHPGAAAFVLVSGALLWLFEGRTRTSLAWGAAAAGLGLVIAAPWLLTVISRHGLNVLTGLPSNGPALGDAVLALLAGRATGLPFIDPLALLGVALAILALVRRQFLLPIWLLAATVISYQYGMVPFGLLIGAFAVDLAATWQQSANRSGARIPAVVAALLAACFVLQGVVSAATVLNPGAPVHALSLERRAANAWVVAELEPGARVAVITNSEWSGDPDSEWFPQLTGRESVATVQGSEWLGQAAFEAQVSAHRALQACVAEASVSCVTDWLADWPADYLYLPKGALHGPSSPDDCCADLRDALLADQRFSRAYDGGATILAVGD